MEASFPAAHARGLQALMGAAASERARQHLQEGMAIEPLCFGRSRFLAVVRAARAQHPRARFVTRRAMEGPDARRLPNLFLLGNPKAGSTFLFSCLRAGPFDPNVLHGHFDAARWRDGTHLLTTLGPKKEFNFWGQSAWGMDWYVGPAAPLSAWEWTGTVDVDSGARRRRGENGNGEPSLDSYLGMPGSTSTGTLWNPPDTEDHEGMCYDNSCA